MKLFILLVITTAVSASCSSPHRTTKAEAATLDTITNINVLKSKGKAIYKNKEGETYIMRYEPDPEDSTEGVQTIAPAPKGGSSDSPPAAAETNKRCDSDTFDGSYREGAKTSLSPAALENFRTLRAFVNTLPGKDLMADSITGSNSPRIASEERNVRIKKAYLYAYSRQADEDFHVIIGTSKKPTASTKYFNVEVSGPPPADDSSFLTLKAARDSFLTKAAQNLCSSGYFFYENPLQVEVSGSIFFDKQHNGGAIGPASARPADAWEIHPVSSFIYK